MQDVKRVDFKAADAAEQFTESLHQTGFAVLYNHPIAKSTIEDTYKAWEEFFLSDTAKKEQFRVDPKTQYGWVPPSQAEIAKGFKVRDIKEFYNFYEKGGCPPELKTLTQNTFNELLSVGKMLLNWIQANTPGHVAKQFEMSLPDMVEDSDWNLYRINYYPALSGTEEEGAVRAAAHADIDLITVLTAGTESGLQAQEKDGEWHDIPCEHGNLVINIGDMLQECSEGYFPSTIHRVLNPVGEAAKRPRMSCPMFIHPRRDVRLSERHTADSYLHERLVELGLR